MPSHLQGLNLVHPPQPEVDSHDLLTGTHFPDIAAQLALWTNLPFEGGEEGSHIPHEKPSPSEEEDEEKRGPAPHDSHVNVVTGTNIGTTEQSQYNLSQRPSASHQSQPFDLHSLIHGFGLNSFQQQQQQQAQEHLSTPSLAQILALHNLTQNPSLYQPQATSSQVSTQQSLPQAAPPTDSNNIHRGSTSSSDITPPPAKRPRARKASVSTADSPTDPTDSCVVSAAEDKRRRNTAASARFRLKKKEREFALETKAKELETRVNELEKECEALRRENGWLKGLVVGVTGAAQTSAQQHNPQTPVLAGLRRPREDDSV
ncbi:hypothetical protein PQX77_014382 [Marasmius sp. AFHP31]|nr:hypothetical protein PQX77_014382 [Marasmius sp. AFHP31]